MQVKKRHLALPELLGGRQTSGGDNRSGCRKNGESDMIWYFKKKIPYVFLRIGFVLDLKPGA